MGRGKRDRMNTVCNMCGDVGVSEELVACNHCKKSSEHIYCMNERPFEIPLLWYCEECLQYCCVAQDERKRACKKQVIFYGDDSIVKSSEGLGKRSLGDKNQPRDGVVHNGTENNSKTHKVVYGYSNELNLKSSENPAKRSLGGDKNQARESVVCNETENKSKKWKVVYDNSNEFNLKSVENSAKRSLGNDKNKTADASADTYNFSSKCARTKERVSCDKDFKTQEMKDSGVAVCSQTLHMPLPLIRNPVEKLSTSHHAPQACWRGTLKTWDMVYHDYQGIQAHLPCVFCPKIEKILKELPKTVQLKVSTRKDMWPKIFQVDPPTKEDIGLYFFPCEQGRPKEKYFRLLERLDAHDFSLWTCIKDVQLLIFSSNQLPEDSRRIAAESYLWGVFLHQRCKKLRMQLKSLAISTTTTTRPVVAGHKESDKTDVPISSNTSPPGLTSPNSNDFKYVRSSFNKYPSNKLADITDPDIPPGFSEIRPPRFSESASSKLNVQLDMKFKEIGMVKRNNISRLDLLIPSIGIQAPDFSKAQLRESNPMKSANPIDQDVPPGFSKILPPGFSESPMSRHQDSSLEAMISDPILSRTDDKNNVEFLSRKVTIPVDPDVPPGFSKILQPVSSKYWHNSCEVAMPSVIVEYHSNKVANSIDSDVPPGFSKLSHPVSLKDHDDKAMCLQASDTRCKPAEPPKSSTIPCSTGEKKESCTKFPPMMDEYTSDADLYCLKASDTRCKPAEPPKSIVCSTGEKKESCTNFAPTSNKYPLDADLYCLKACDTRCKSAEPPESSAIICSTGKTKSIDDFSKGRCPSKVRDKDITSSPSLGCHAADTPKGCQVQLKCCEATNCDQKPAEHPASNSPTHGVKEKKDFTSLASVDIRSKHYSIIKDHTTYASPLPAKKKLHSELKTSLSLVSLSTVKSRLLEFEENRKLEGRERQDLNSKNSVSDKQNLVSDDKPVASTHESPISSSQGSAQTSLVSAFYGSPSIFRKSRANGSKS